VRIEGPQVGDKVLFEENPGLARFGTGNFSGFGFAPQVFCRHLQEGGGLV